MATAKKPIKKAQVGVKIDKTSVAKPKVRGTIKNEPTYNRMLSSNTTKKDKAREALYRLSSTYKKKIISMLTTTFGFIRSDFKKKKLKILLNI